MGVRFTKMQALGNDFVVLDAMRRPLPLDGATVRRLADRHFGIGCDQVLVVEPGAGGTDFRMRILNADGGEVEQCGNGARAFFRYVRERGLTDKDEIRVLTGAGPIVLRGTPGGRVSVDMGVPRFEPAEVPFTAPERRALYDLEVGGETVTLSVLSMGNPHAVQIVEDLDRAPVVGQGAQIESHPRFPKRVNAGFMQLRDRGHVRLRVFERGVGETLACGSGACAAVAAGRMRGLLDERVEVELPGGCLTVEWAGEGRPVIMTGPAEFVFDGEIDLDRRPEKFRA
jgi:diaminopimelate epimerase